MRIFVLEDEIDREPRNAITSILKDHSLTIAKNVIEARSEFLATPEPFDLLLLDHDMRGFFDPSDFWNTGFQFCKWLVTRDFGGKKPPVVLHSQNYTGRKNMSKLLNDHEFTVSEFYFGPDYLDWLRKIDKIGRYDAHPHQKFNS